MDKQSTTELDHSIHALLLMMPVCIVSSIVVFKDAIDFMVNKKNCISLLKIACSI
jgi:hypothetical protein